MIYLQLFYTFFKIGLFGFGGGYAMLSMIQGEVVRYQLPQLAAMNFVIYGALGGGVTRSLSLDPHGKSLSSHLLDIEIQP